MARSPFVIASGAGHVGLPRDAPVSAGSRDAAGGLGHSGAVAAARGAGRPVDRTADAHRGHDPTRRVHHRGAHRRHARLALLHALDPAGAGPVAQHPPAGPTVERQAGAHGDDRAQLVWGLQRLDAHPLVVVAYVELHRLAGLLLQPCERRAGVEPAGHGLGGGVAQPDQAQPQREPAVLVTPHQPVGLERDRQAMGGGPGQAGRGHQPGQRLWAPFERAQHADRLVHHPDTTYAVHFLRTLSRYVRRRP